MFHHSSTDYQPYTRYKYSHQSRLVHQRSPCSFRRAGKCCSCRFLHYGSLGRSRTLRRVLHGKLRHNRCRLKFQDYLVMKGFNTIASFAHQSVAAGTSSNALDSWLHGSKRSELGGKVHPAVGELLEWREGNSVLVCAQIDWS